MKKIIYILITCYIGIFTSCDSLDLSPEDYYGSGNFWNNSSQVEGFMVGMHQDFRETYQAMFLLGEARGGTSKNGTSSLNVSIDYSSPIKDNDFTKDKTGISNWNGIYAKLLQVNLFIQEVESGCSFLNKDNRSYLLGQAYGIRAFYYFLLYRTYGGVPLITDVKVMNGITSPKELYNPRATPKQTLDLIKDDLKKSDDNFGTDFTIKAKAAMWSKAATLVLKGEVYLWSAKVETGDQKPASTDLKTAQDALLLLKRRFGLQLDFKDVFDVKKKGNNEIIMAYRFIDGESTNWASNFLYSDPVFIGQVYDSNGNLINTDALNLKSTGILRHEYKFELFESYDNDDSRKKATFFDFYKKDGNGIIIEKGLLMVKATGSINLNGNRVYDNDIPIYRYADVLLLLAEIENKMGGDPSEYINEVIQRAYGSKFEDYKFINNDFATNELAILRQRDKEFVWEGKRWFDVCRMHDASGKPLVFSIQANYGATSPILSAVETHKLLWPIDVNTLNNDPTLEQTFGYNN